MAVVGFGTPRLCPASPQTWAEQCAWDAQGQAPQLTKEEMVVGRILARKHIVSPGLGNGCGVRNLLTQSLG